ncbi:MAG: hypothetical protein ACI91R_002056, partial [Vicingaceae bacterium]
HSDSKLFAPSKKCSETEVERILFWSFKQIDFLF